MRKPHPNHRRTALAVPLMAVLTMVLIAAGLWLYFIVGVRISIQRTTSFAQISPDDLDGPFVGAPPADKTPSIDSVAYWAFLNHASDEDILEMAREGIITFDCDDQWGNPLHLSVRFDRHPLMAPLIALGCDPFQQCDISVGEASLRAITPVQFAIWKVDEPAIAALLDPVCTTETPAPELTTTIQSHIDYIAEIDRFGRRNHIEAYLQSKIIAITRE